MTHPSHVIILILASALALAGVLHAGPAPDADQALTLSAARQHGRSPTGESPPKRHVPGHQPGFPTCVTASMACPEDVPLTSMSVAGDDLPAPFLAALGLTPFGYLERGRIETAGRMLATGRLRIQEIATAVGYRGSAAFRDAFVRSLGRRPTLHRRLLMQERMTAAAVCGEGWAQAGHEQRATEADPCPV